MNGKLKLSNDLYFSNYVYAPIVGIGDGYLFPTRYAARFDLEFTWQQSEAPPALWELREKAELFYSDPSHPSVTAANNNGHVDYFFVREHNLPDQSIIFGRRYSASGKSSYSEEVSLIFPCDANEEHGVYLDLKTNSRIAPYIFDKLSKHSEDFTAKSKKRKVESGDSSMSVPSDNLLSFQSIIENFFPSLKMNSNPDSDVNVNVSSYLRLWENYTTDRTRIHGNVQINQIPANFDYGGYDSIDQLQIKFNKTATLTIPQLLQACNLSHLVQHFPSILIDKIRLTQCSMRVDHPASDESIKFVHAVQERTCLIIL